MPGDLLLERGRPGLSWDVTYVRITSDRAELLAWCEPDTGCIGLGTMVLDGAVGLLWRTPA